MISEDPNPQNQDLLISNLLLPSYNEFMHQLNQANVNLAEIYNPENVKIIDFLIKINQRVAEACGRQYLNYLKGIFNDLLKLYGLYSSQITQAVSQGQGVGNLSHMLKPMKAVRKDILKLIQTYILKETDKSYQFFYSEFLPSLVSLTQDYQKGHPDARDPEVLNLFATMIEQMGETLRNDLQGICDQLSSCTLDVLKGDF